MDICSFKNVDKQTYEYTIQYAIMSKNNMLTAYYTSFKINN